MDQTLGWVETHGLAVVLVVGAIVLVGVPAGKALARLVNSGAQFVEESLKLVMNLAHGDGNGNAPIRDLLASMRAETEALRLAIESRPCVKNPDPCAWDGRHTRSGESEAEPVAMVGAGR